MIKRTKNMSRRAQRNNRVRGPRFDHILRTYPEERSGSAGPWAEEEARKEQRRLDSKERQKLSAKTSRPTQQRQTNRGQ